MDQDAFWELIAEAREHAVEPAGQAAWLARALERRGADAIEGFHFVFARLMARAYRWDLWGVASLAHGGHGDEEAFMGFRGWLASLGREAFEAALEDPDSLAPHVRKDIDGTPMAYVARDAYQKVTGSELPTPTLDLFAEPIGEPVLQSDLSTRFPRVAKALGVE